MKQLAAFIVSIVLRFNKKPQKPVPTLGGLCVLYLLVILPACTPPWSSPAPSSSYQFTLGPISPEKEILVCDDRTGSVKGIIYDAGLRLTVRNLSSIIHMGQGSITFTLAKIDRHSYLPESTIVTGEISAAKPPPQQPLLSPFLDPNIKKQIMDQYSKLQHDAEQSLQQAQTQAAQLEAEIMQHDSHHVAVDTMGTDILGCLLKAKDLFSQDQGIQHYLLVVSDLVQNIDVSRGVSLHLTNVAASIVFYCSDPAKVCQNRKLFYQTLLTHAGAQVTFYDVSHIDLVNGVFGN